MASFAARLPPLSEDEHGVVRVGRSRVSLESVVLAFDRGASAEEIVDAFPALDLATAYATLAFVLAERDRVDAYLAERERALGRLRAQAEERSPAEGLRARLIARRRPRP
jgi:uncharacterized protein (DUF433 family)